MLPIEFTSFAKNQPFRPFRVTLSNGWSYDIVHPDMAVVGYGSVMIGVPPKLKKADDDSDVLISLSHVMKLEYIERE